jgi:protein-L-isoaspartate O-methyltransferase
MKADLTTAPATDPTSVYRWRDGLYAADLLTCALVHLDFFSWVGKRAVTKEEICREFGIHERPTDVMITLFVAMGYLVRRGEGVELTEVAREHLVKSSPFFLGPYYASLKDRPVCKDFLEVLRTDKPANWGSFKGEKDWARAMEDEAFANNFTAAMDCRGVFLGQALAKALDLSSHEQLLDVAGGSGIYACALADRWEMVAAVFEKAPVDKVAERAIAQRGFSDRVRVIEGDMFKEELPRGFDVHLISNVLHDWNEKTVRELLKKSYAALERGGMLIIHDVHINEEKTGPLPNAAYSAMLMHATEGKCYSTSEFYPMLREIGFTELNFTETAADRSAVTARKD